MEVAIFERKLRMAQGLPLELQVDFLLGLPGDTVETVERSAEFVRAAIRGKKVAQISPFLLSVGSATRFRREADSLGIHYQAGPPYRVTSTPGLSYAEIRSLRRRMPALLGAAEHPFWDLDRPHYALNFFEPELFEADPGVAGTAPVDSLIDVLRIECPGGAADHKHPFEPGPHAYRLAQLAQLRLKLDDPGACARHVEDLLFRLSEPNPYTVWDLVFETAGPFDLGTLQRTLSALQWRVNNLDWDNHMVNREEGRGYARVAERLFVLVPLGSAGHDWCAAAARQAVLVHSFRVSELADIAPGFAAALELPGEGVLVDLAPDASPATTLATLQEMARSRARIRAFRDPALKALLEGRSGARLPWRDRVTLAASADGSVRRESLTRRSVRIERAARALALSRVPRP